MTDEYDQHLAGLHGGFAAPDAVIRAAAREASASPLVGTRRIVHGEANEVYALAFESGLEVIMRIARRAEGLFEKERWAIGLCRSLGVKAPEVLSIQRREAVGEMLEICIQEKLPGERLADSLGLPRETLRAIVREVGEQLSRMHAIAWENLGDAVRYFESDTDDTIRTIPEFIDLGAAAGLDRSVLERACARLTETLERGAPQPRRLTHNDIRACHVMVHQGRLSGLIDFGEASMEAPINDLAKWDYWEGEVLPVAWLEEGYTDKSLFDESYGERFAAFRIVNALWALRWYALTGYARGVAEAKARLERYFAELGFA
jgi:aminoglycoside phosphotransferase (APT) family kinase protein